VVISKILFQVSSKLKLYKSVSTFLFTDRISHRTSSHQKKKEAKPYANTRSWCYNR